MAHESRTSASLQRRLIALQGAAMSGLVEAENNRRRLGATVITRGVTAPCKEAAKHARAGLDHTEQFRRLMLFIADTKRELRRWHFEPIERKDREMKIDDARTAARAHLDLARTELTEGTQALHTPN